MKELRPKPSRKLTLLPEAALRGSCLDGFDTITEWEPERPLKESKLLPEAAFRRSCLDDAGCIEEWEWEPDRPAKERSTEVQEAEKTTRSG